MTVLIFLAVLFVLVLVHEWGHFIVAKLTGMRVDEFGIGFPPKLFSFRRGETLYTLNALPLGGFVKIYGEDGSEGSDTLDKPRAFSARPKWAQALVLLAGVTMNWIFAWFLLVAILMIGVPSQIEENMATDKANLYVEAVLPDSPADKVLPPQSKIISVKSGGDTLEKLLPSTFSDFIASHSGQDVSITYADKNNVEATIDVNPKENIIPGSPDRAAIGVSLSLIEQIKRPFTEAIPEATNQVYSITKSIVGGLFGMIGNIFVGKADFSQVAGPIGIVHYVGDAAAVGFTSLLFFTAVISMNLAVINLLPIPALDGGRLIFVAIETITRRPIPPIWAGRVNFVGFVLLMLLMLAATIHDILKLW